MTRNGNSVPVKSTRMDFTVTNSMKGSLSNYIAILKMNNSFFPK